MALTTKLAQTTLATTLTLGIFGLAQAQATDPNAFVQEIANSTLAAFKADAAARGGDTNAINAIVEKYLVPHVNFEKTTRLAVGQPWRKATLEQKNQLVNSFKGKLVRTYSGTFKNINNSTRIEMQPFRGDPQAYDVVVRLTIIAANGPVDVDYRLEKNGNTWKVYDLNVEGIWWIQNYRNQFSSEINKNGIDGLIKSLNQPSNK